MRVVLRRIGSKGSSDTWGVGHNTMPSQTRDVLLGGYAVSQPVDEGERNQARLYDAVIETPGGLRYALIVRLEEGDQ